MDRDQNDAPMKKKHMLLLAEISKDYISFVEVEFEEEKVLPIRWWQFWRWHLIPKYYSFCRKAEKYYFECLQQVSEDSQEFQCLLMFWHYFKNNAPQGFIREGTIKASTIEH